MGTDRLQPSRRAIAQRYSILRARPREDHPDDSPGMGQPEDLPISHSCFGLGIPWFGASLTCSTGYTYALAEVPTCEERAISVGLHRIHPGTLLLCAGGHWCFSLSSYTERLVFLRGLFFFVLLFVVRLGEGANAPSQNRKPRFHSNRYENKRILSCACPYIYIYIYIYIYVVRGSHRIGRQKYVRYMSMVKITE